MNKWLPWAASAALFAVGGGAVYLSTVGLDDTQAATLDYITAPAEQGEVIVTSAATGSVTAADSYSLAFGEDPTPHRARPPAAAGVHRRRVPRTAHAPGRHRGQRQPGAAG
jgi:hypothetical protein